MPIPEQSSNIKAYKALYIDFLYSPFHYDLPFFIEMRWWPWVFRNINSQFWSWNTLRWSPSLSQLYLSLKTKAQNKSHFDLYVLIYPFHVHGPIPSRKSMVYLLFISYFSFIAFIVFFHGYKCSRYTNYTHTYVGVLDVCPHIFQPNKYWSIGIVFFASNVMELK